MLSQMMSIQHIHTTQEYACRQQPCQQAANIRSGLHGACGHVVGAAAAEDEAPVDSERRPSADGADGERVRRAHSGPR